MCQGPAWHQSCKIIRDNKKGCTFTRKNRSTRFGFGDVIRLADNIDTLFEPSKEEEKDYPIFTTEDFPPLQTLSPIQETYEEESVAMVTDWQTADSISYDDKCNVFDPDFTRQTFGSAMRVW